MEAKVPSTKGCVIYWVRHGETHGNQQKVVSSPKSFLTDKGKLQAKAAGVALSDIVFTRAYCSNLPRAVETGEIILKESKHSQSLNLNIDPRIKEREYGEFEGKSYDVVTALRGKELDDNHPLLPYSYFYLKGAEEIMHILNRAESFFQDLVQGLEKSPLSETVLIVSHGYFSSLWMHHLGIPNRKHKVNSYSESLSGRLRNCAYHKFTLSSELEGSKEKGGMLCWDFLEANKENHLSTWI